MMRRYIAIILAALMLLAVGCAAKEQLNWDGNFHNYNGYLAISECTNKNFRFVFLMNDGKELRGVADVKGSEAEYGDILFSLAGDTLVVTLRDGAADAGLSVFTGTFTMNSVGTMVDEGSPQEMGLPEQTTEPVVEQQPEEQTVLEVQPETEQPALETEAAE